MVILLLLKKGIKEYGVQVFGQGSLIAFGNLHDFGNRHDTVNHMESVKRLFCAADTVGLCANTLRTDLRIGIAHIGIFELLGGRSFVDILYEVTTVDLVSKQPQILSCDGLQYIHAAASVPDAVMGFQGDPAVIIVDPDQIPVSGFEGHGHAEIPDVLPDKGTGPFIWFQIPPEKPFPDRCFIGGKTDKTGIHSLLQDIRPDGFFQYYRKTVDRRKIPALQGRVDDGGKIQPVPDLFGSGNSGPL